MASTTTPTKRDLRPEFRRFTNALRSQDVRGQWWSFTADTRVGVLVVAINEQTAPEKAQALRKLIATWRGEVYEHG